MCNIELRAEFLQLLDNADNMYDLIACCYRELIFYRPNRHKQFITGCIDNLGKEKTYKPYAKNFRQLRTDLTNLFLRMNVRQGDEGSGYNQSECVRRLLRYLQSFTLPDDKCLYEDAMAIVFFYVLEAMDHYIKNEIRELSVYDRMPSGVLNKNYETTECYVYFKEQRSFLDEAYSIGKKGFRKPLRAVKLGEKFTTIQIVNKNQLLDSAGIPVIKYVQNKAADYKNGIRICYIPYIGFRTFSFHNRDEEKPCGIKEHPSGLFYIDYDNWNEEEHEKYLLILLQKAIEKQPHIIVFPEFVMSPSLLKSLQKHLMNNTIKNGKKNLQVVVAGSTYEKSIDDRWNNVSHILSGSGREIGKYYKFTPYSDEEAPQAHGAQQNDDEDDAAKYYNNCEILSDPGLECTIIDVEGIGRILPAICRDVIEGEYTEKLAQVFNPSLLIIPAWSGSVKSFDTRILSITNTAHTAALMCNCCDAVPKKNNEVGTLYLPQKDERVMKAIPKYLERRCACKNDCKNKNGCLYLIDIIMNEGILKSNVEQIYGLDIEI